MTAPRAQIPAGPADHPLRKALARGELAHASSAPALQHLLAADDLSLIGEAVVVQVRGMLGDLANQLAFHGRSPSYAPQSTTRELLLSRLFRQADLRAHCQALALEWRLTQRLESELGIDPVLSPLLQEGIGTADAGAGSLVMAALAAQARFTQSQRRMQLPIAELPAELFDAVLAAAREVMSEEWQEAGLRADYDEAATRLALFQRLAHDSATGSTRALQVEDAGVALWLGAIATRSGESRDRTACAAADPNLGRLLLTLRAAGATPAEAERQALYVQPNVDLPSGLGDVGTREAAQWLAEAQS